jgi:transcriptional regulator with XRE-family HTH domain
VSKGPCGHIGGIRLAATAESRSHLSLEEGTKPVPDTANILDETPDMDTMGGRLSRAREATDLSAKDLAWRLGVRISTVNAWESDRSQPNAHRLAVLAGVLNVSLSWLLHGVGTSPSEAETGTLVSAATAQLDRIKRLHLETGNLIERLETDLQRLREPALSS